MNAVTSLPMNNKSSHQNPAVQMIPATNNPLDSPVDSFESALDRRQSNRLALIHWIKNNLIEGTDYGSIKTKRGPSKPSLWKAGAEKITMMLSVSALFPSYADYEHSAIAASNPLQHIIIRCELINAQQTIVASGIGARSLKQDFGDINKALKMASKSAYIDATLKLAGLSDIFTLDLEDMTPEQVSPATTVKSNKSHPSVNKSPVKPTVQMISPKQLTALEAIIEQDDIHPTKLLNWLSKVCESQGYQSIQQFSQLPVILVDQVMKKLPEFANTANT